ncbi:hypothetical protein OV079_51855 [Nannocystis pusilla]|uniref:Uncharacterized protein n=1 Tax=Nannocystis pusilla TaxID=889268 RepID=A0A9X3J2J8_9BACT|nr:hypothetical protein [Nannocystis pusilla]MCY1013887.1 hypothetical protein [Nannocystis pusilla]
MQDVTRLGNVITEYGLESSVGINLIHKHFDLAADELVLREFEGDAAFMRPKRARECRGHLPYLWKLDRERAARAGTAGFVHPLPEHHIDARAEIETIRAAVEFLDALADCLEELELADLFGIVSLASRRPFELDSETTLLETTDEVGRVLTLRPTPRDALETMDTTKTLWVFSPGRDRRLTAGTQCVSHCISHCHGHVLQRPDVASGSL